MRYFLIPILFTLLLFQTPHKSSADELVTVKLNNDIKDTNELTVQFNGDYFSLDSTLTIKEGVVYNLTEKNGQLILSGDNETLELGDSLVVLPGEYNQDHFVEVNERPYLGAFEFTIEEDGNIRPVNQLPLEDYLKGVVPFEVFPTWGIETLKSQALAARTYAVSHLNKVIDDTISYQVYGGYQWMDTTTQAVEETKGEVLTYNNKLIEAFYSASNGGITENNAHVWGGKEVSYYPIKNDPYDPINPWEFKLHSAQVVLEEIDWDNDLGWEEATEMDQELTGSMSHWLQRNGYPGDIKILSISNFTLSAEKLNSNRSVSGSIKIDFLQRLYDGTILLQEYELNDEKLNKIRPLIGGTQFKSYLIDSLEFKDGIYTMKGKGYGHGVGMSQWGAHIMGQLGKNYKEIVQFYFPGTEITKYVK
ncbi:SpoIID/LytB domain-containing protein [Cytobacillus sp. S13-E01]|uniref:SpoIID/LytB domain-containing protein n=1 Tax=Cytobacillus sp. S13-E01 TaxID=3031326 RepID=UPI0023D889A0|nr:SpoIID/LytB domain-containing protein [Cytobacillus sp. S13-E01]MDF0725590.1 SpoIID/LytB domain-containing protein [Cytobacillus sp. S13-E01]